MQILPAFLGRQRARHARLRQRDKLFNLQEINTHRPIPAGGCQARPVRAEGHARDDARMGGQGDKFLAVADGLADGAAVDSLVYDFAVSRDPSLGAKTRIIHRSPAFGIPPVVVSPNVRPQLKAELQSLLLSLADDPQGQQALQAIGVERFVVIDDSAYDSARELLKAVGPLLP